jgi:hypothetical protein
MDCARTVWAEGYGFSAETIEDLAEIAEESDRRCQNGARPNLATGDLSQWAAELDAFDMQDLAEQVRALAEYV